MRGNYFMCDIISNTPQNHFFFTNEWYRKICFFFVFEIWGNKLCELMMIWKIKDLYNNFLFFKSNQILIDVFLSPAVNDIPWPTKHF